jgi:hypothetical protein
VCQVYTRTAVARKHNSILTDNLTNVAASNSAAASRAGGEHSSAVIGRDVNNLSIGGRSSARRSRGRGASEADSAKVGQVNLASTLLEGLDDPLRVGFAERGGRAGESMRNLLSSGQVLESSNAGGLGGSIDLHLDLVSDADREAAEAIGIVGNPLIPSIKGSVGVEGDAGLENGRLAGIAVDANPSRSCGAIRAADFRNSNGSDNLVVALADRDGTGPVARVADIGIVVGHKGFHTLDGRRAVLGAASRARSQKRGVSLSERSSRSGRGNAGDGSEDDRVLHGETEEIPKVVRSVASWCY